MFSLLFVVAIISLFIFIRPCSNSGAKLLLTVIFSLSVFNSDALSQSTNTVSDNMVSGQYLLKFSKRIQSRLARHSIRSQLGLNLVKTHKVIGTELVQAKNAFSYNHQYAKELLAQGLIDYIEPNYVIKLNAITPNDSNFNNLWGFHNNGQTGGRADVDIDAPESWELTTGSNETVVGVVDTGIDYNHQDLKTNIWTNPSEIPNNGLDDDHNGIIDDIHGFNAINNSGNPLDDHGHGSHVAGTIGAVGNNGSGVTGVNWNVKLMALKFLDSFGSGSIEGAISSIEYAINMRASGINLKVLNNSWGGGDYSLALQDAINAANNSGLLFVAAAGNNSQDTDLSPSYPSCYELPNVLSVAAIDHNGNLAQFSNYGATTVDIAAPGVDILSTYLNNGYTSMSGTSMAAPHVSGVAALVAGREPGLSILEIKNRLMSTAKPLSNLNGTMQAPAIVNSLNSLTNALTDLPPPPVEFIYNRETTVFAYDTMLGSKVLSADDGYYQLELPFSFSYYGGTFNRIAISANGRILPLSSAQNAPQTLDYANSPMPGISPYHDDLYPSPLSNDGGAWVNIGVNSVTVTWVVVSYAHRFSADLEKELRFQAKIRDNGRIEFHYLDTLSNDTYFDYGASATVSISPVSGTAGSTLTVSHNTNNPSVIGNNKALALITVSGFVHADFDGDRKSDIIVWRPSSGMWFILKSSTGFNYDHHQQIQLGLPGDVPIVGDFDGDRKSDLAVWRPSDGNWFFRYSANNWNAIVSIQWGLPGDTPLTGDFDGDRVNDLAVYRPSNGLFYILRSSGNFNRTAALLGQSQSVMVINLGGHGFDPIVGDFNGDGQSDLGAVWQLARFWVIKDSSNQLVYSAPWGQPGDTPLGCDWDGDGFSDRIVVRVNPNNSLSWFGALANFDVNVSTFGLLGDTPKCDNDYDGDGKADQTVFRPQSGAWYIKMSTTNSLERYFFGLPGDIAL